MAKQKGIAFRERSRKFAAKRKEKLRKLEITARKSRKFFRTVKEEPPGEDI